MWNHRGILGYLTEELGPKGKYVIDGRQAFRRPRCGFLTHKDADSISPAVFLKAKACTTTE
jgi:hypothetical protein